MHHAYRADRCAVFDVHHLVAVPVVLYDMNIDVGRELERAGIFLQIVEPDAAMGGIFGFFRAAVFRDHLVQRPAQLAMHILHRHAFELLGQGARQGLGVVPQVDAGHPRHPVNGFTANDGQQIFPMAYRRHLNSPIWCSARSDESGRLFRSKTAILAENRISYL